MKFRNAFVLSLCVALPALPVASAERTDVVAMIQRFRSFDSATLLSMQPIPVERFAVPNPGVDFMRARVEETYEIQGVGTDTVDLTGWIAVRHDAARPAPGQTEVKWGTAQMDTEFVGLELHGRSALFGRIKVVLDEQKPSRGIVGYWPRDQVPEQAQVLERMLASTTPGADPAGLFRGDCGPAVRGGRDGRPNAPQGDRIAQVTPVTGPSAVPEPSSGALGLDGQPSAPKGDMIAQVTPITGPSVVTKPSSGASGPLPLIAPMTLQPGGGLAPMGKCNCAANLHIKVIMVDLGLELGTDGPVYMHSAVETIPPVGYTATVSLTPARLMRNGVPVGVLRHAAVTFRELVAHVPLGPDNRYYALAQPKR